MAYYLKSNKLKGGSLSAEHKDELSIFGYIRPSISVITHASSGGVARSTDVSRSSNVFFSCVFGPGLISLLDFLVSSETFEKALITTTGSIDNSGKGMMKEKAMSIDTYQNLVFNEITCCFDEDDYPFENTDLLSQHFAYVSCGFQAVKTEDIRFSSGHAKKSSEAAVLSPNTGATKK